MTFIALFINFYNIVVNVIFFNYLARAFALIGASQLGQGKNYNMLRVSPFGEIFFAKYFYYVKLRT